ncbi:MAG: RIP metalloprotease RseP [Selenomonadaceae bacterium]|nr:RIP metalloprotease RseP [Selenomonadaceae bacterium]
MLLTLAAAIFVFGLLVLVHEWGHFITAKLTGMRVDEFAIGFGPQLFKTKRGETVYSVRAIPLGGFNDIAGMDPADNNAGERGFCEKPVFSRMIVILAGSAMNFIMPIVLFFGIYAFAGVATPSTEPVIGAVVEGKAAAEAGLLAGDKILSVNGEKISTWQEVSEKIKISEPEKPVAIEYERNSQIKTVSIVPEFDSSMQRNLIGVQSSIVYESKSVGEAFFMSIEHTADILKMMIGALIDIIQSPSQADVAGPIGITKMAGQVAERGFIPLLNFAALLSLNLGIINLLPVPALDGGHFVSLAIEAVRGKPLSPKAMMYTQRVGVALLIALTIVVTTSDVLKIFFK